MTDVTIPADKAKTIAQYHRDRSNASRQLVSRDAAQWHRETADLLDPPPTLRDMSTARPSSAPRAASGRWLGMSTDVAWTFILPSVAYVAGILCGHFGWPS